MVLREREVDRKLLLVDDHGAGEATLSGFTVSVDIVVGPYLFVAVLFNLRLARAASFTTTDETPNSDAIADLEFGDFRSHLHDLTYHFVSASTNPTNKKAKHHQKIY